MKDSSPTPPASGWNARKIIGAARSHVAEPGKPIRWLWSDEELLDALSKLQPPAPAEEGQQRYSKALIRRGEAGSDGDTESDAAGQPPRSLARPDSHGWQTIDSAPKDGTFIWLGRPGSLRIGYWSQGRWADFCRSGWQGRQDLLFTPTHWRPLPEPPSP